MIAAAPGAYGVGACQRMPGCCAHCGACRTNATHFNYQKCVRFAIARGAIVHYTFDF